MFPAVAFAHASSIGVAARTFAFFPDLATSEQSVMVIYDPANSDSRIDAERAVEELSQEKMNKLRIKPVLTPVNAIGSARIAYISEGMQHHYAAIAAASKASGILTFTRDKACVEAKLCVMYVNAKPSVEIRVSQSALLAANLRMASALKMMVKEVE